MAFTFPELHKGKLLKRYKRFFADIETEDGIITAHNPNTGSMKSLLNNGIEPINHPALYSVSSNPDRKLPYTLELIKVKDEWVISNTHRVNFIVEDALINSDIKELPAGKVIREFKYKDSRIDFLIESEKKKTLVEVKSVTYFDNFVCYFPDAVTSRGLKHLNTLMDGINNGYDAAMLYVCMVKRNSFECAKHIDPAYCAGLEKAAKRGVEIITVYCEFDEKKNQAQILPFIDK